MDIKVIHTLYFVIILAVLKFNAKIFKNLIYAIISPINIENRLHL